MGIFKKSPEQIEAKRLRDLAAAQRQRKTLKAQYDKAAKRSAALSGRWGVPQENKDRAAEEARTAKTALESIDARIEDLSTRGVR